MKKNKIKNKYQRIIKINKNINKIENIEQMIKKILLTTSLIMLLLFTSSICLIFLKIFNLNYNNLKQNQKIIYLTITDIAVIATFIIIYKKTIFKDFKNYFNKNFINNIKTSIKYWIIGIIIMITSNIIIINLLKGNIAGNEESVRTLIDKQPLYMLFQLAIYAPLTEEIIFRKSINDIFKNKYIYILASGLIFGGMHIISNISTPIDILYIIPYGALGAIFATLYRKTNNIFSTITIHSMHNTLTLILYLIANI